jgi:hypothetical protein
MTTYITALEGGVNFPPIAFFFVLLFVISYFLLNDTYFFLHFSRNLTIFLFFAYLLQLHNMLTLSLRSPTLAGIEKSQETDLRLIHHK